MLLVQAYVLQQREGMEVYTKKGSMQETVLYGCSLSEENRKREEQIMRFTVPPQDSVCSGLEETLTKWQ